MANLIGFTTVDRILAKSYRELKETDLDESDAIEWIGEALDFLSVFEVQEEAVTFLEVKNFEAELPKGFQMVLQVAKMGELPSEENYVVDNHEDLPRLDVTPIKEDDCNTTCYKPYFDMQIQYVDWIQHSLYKQSFKPIRLANHIFFNDIVCKEKGIYENNHCDEEYTIVGTTERKLRFSFQEGIVALSYVRAAIDKETGYPLIPDDIRFITAITYYLKWKIAEYFSWSRKEGFDSLADKAEAKWLKYAKQAKNYAKMPKTVDQFQNLLESTHNMIPNHKRYYNHFGNLGRRDKVKFNDPDYRNR